MSGDPLLVWDKNKIKRNIWIEREFIYVWLT